MRSLSLTLKLTLGFMLISLIGMSLAAMIIRGFTETEFNRYLYDQDKESIISVLENYYTQHGNWDGVGEFLFPKPENTGDPFSAQELANRSMYRQRNHYIVLDADGHVVYGSEIKGKSLDDDFEENGTAIQVNGAVVGWLLPDNVHSDSLDKLPEDAFLVNVEKAIVISLLITVVLAVLLGWLFTRFLTRPLRDLTHATQAVAQGKLGTRVDIRSRDEIGNLATSFNQMSTDLEKANRIRREMTADIAHDLRTPLSVLLGYTEALSDGKLPGTPEIYQVMHQETRHLKVLIDDLRTLSMADAGELPLNLQLIQPGMIFQRTAAALKARAEEKGIQIEMELAEPLPDLQLDPDRMAQVFGNLVSNALRYTPPQGKITLAAFVRAGNVIMQVRDTGTGIAPEDLPNIFNRFYRGEKSRQDNGDAGLGLSIAKSLVELHHGTIQVESKPGEGAVFTISLPVKK